MLDLSVPYSPIFMVRAALPLPALPVLPEGFSYRTYKDGDAQAWAEVETAVGSFERVKDALSYFEKEFLSRPDLLSTRFGGICDPSGRMIAHAAAWEREGQPLFHWLATDPAYQRQGLGRAAALYALHLFPKDKRPVLLHTQTTSHVAIKMYAGLGFRFVKTPLPGNEFEKTTEILSTVMEESLLTRLITDAVELQI